MTADPTRTTLTPQAKIRQLAQETYRKVRAAHPHMPTADTVERQRKIDRLYDILWKNVEAS